MDKIIIDTSFLIAYYNLKDDNHNKAEKVMNDLISKNYDVYISDYIFDECCTVLLMRLKDSKKCIEVCNLIKSLEMLNIDESGFENSWNIFKEQKKTKMSFTDCSTLALMDANGIEKITTFDEEFDKIKEVEVLN